MSKPEESNLEGDMPGSGSTQREESNSHPQDTNVRPSLATAIFSSESHSAHKLGGRYKLISVIGEGGMGAVWLGEQRVPVKRLVAVKLIKAGMDSKAVLARFDAERQALAMMDHPNIAKILDGGITETGSPYFVMELVKGVPITEYCDTKKLDVKKRLELFIPICQAIQHAHQKGIIHRDIKPSNVLVASYDDIPVPKVIDFGVAKATGQSLTDQTLNTGFGVVGTPQYMSPEQATMTQLDIDTRSDIYSLGVLLYELLTGSTPFGIKELHKAGYLEILRVIREDEPQRPSTKLSTADQLPSIAASRSTEPKKLTGLLRTELDWVVMKALEKDRVRRYDTANAFAADIERYLAGDPVVAHPPSRAYRLIKFIRKHRIGIVAASITTVSLLASSIGTSIAWLAADRQRLISEKATLDANTLNLKLAEERKNAVLARDAAIKAKQELYYKLYVQNVRFAKELMLRSDFDGALDAIQQVGGVDYDSRRGFEWHLMNGMLTCSKHGVNFPESSFYGDFSRDGNTFVVVLANKLLIYNTEDWTMRREIKLPPPIPMAGSDEVDWSLSTRVRIQRTFLNSRGSKAALTCNYDKSTMSIVVNLEKGTLEAEVNDKLLFFGPDDELWSLEPDQLDAYRLRRHDGTIEITGVPQSENSRWKIPKIIGCTSESILLDCDPHVVEASIVNKNCNTRITYPRGFYYCELLPNSRRVVLSPNQYQFQPIIPKPVVDLDTGQDVATLPEGATIHEDPTSIHRAIVLKSEVFSHAGLADVHNALIGDMEELLSDAPVDASRENVDKVYLPFFSSDEVMISPRGDKLAIMRKEESGSSLTVVPFPPKQSVRQVSLPETLNDCDLVHARDELTAADHFVVIRRSDSSRQVIGTFVREKTEYTFREYAKETNFSAPVNYFSKKGIVIGLSGSQLVVLDLNQRSQVALPAPAGAKLIATDLTGDTVVVAGGSLLTFYSLEQRKPIKTIELEKPKDVVAVTLDAAGKNVFLTDYADYTWQKAFGTMMLYKVPIDNPSSIQELAVTYPHRQTDGRLAFIRPANQLRFHNSIVNDSAFSLQVQTDRSPMSVSPDGKRMISYLPNGKAWNVVDTERQEEVFRIDNSEEIRSAYFLSDHQVLVMYRNKFQLLGSNP